MLNTLTSNDTVLSIVMLTLKLHRAWCSAQSMQQQLFSLGFPWGGLTPGPSFHMW